MKIFIRVISSILLFLSSLLLVASLSAQKVMSSDLSMFAKQQINLGDYLATAITPLQEVVSEDKQTAFTTFINNVKMDKELNALGVEYANVFIYDVIGDTTKNHSVDSEAVNTKVKSIIQNYVPQMKELLPAIVPEAQKDAAINEKIATIDVSKYYNQKVEETRVSLSGPYISLLQMANTLASSLWMVLSIIVLGVTLLLLVVDDLRSKVWGKGTGMAFFLSGLILFLVYFAMSFLFGQVLSILGIADATFGASAKRIVLCFGVGFFVVGLISFIVSVKIMNPSEEY